MTQEAEKPDPMLYTALAKQLADEWWGTPPPDAVVIVLERALRLGAAHGRLAEFLVIKQERPMNPVYWDMHEENRLRAEVAEGLQAEKPDPVLEAARTWLERCLPDDELAKHPSLLPVMTAFTRAQLEEAAQIAEGWTPRKGHGRWGTCADIAAAIREHFHLEGK